MPELSRLVVIVAHQVIVGVGSDSELAIFVVWTPIAVLLSRHYSHDWVVPELSQVHTLAKAWSP